jgi:type I restriction enzyme S subunit
LKGLDLSLVPRAQLEFSGRIDAEYYRPEFLDLEKTVKNRGSKPLADVAEFLIGPFGSAFAVENFTEDTSFRYIRGKDVKPLRLMDDNNVFMPRDDFNRLSKYALKDSDVLVSVVGTLGNAALVTQKDLPAIFSCKSTAIRNVTINPVYLTVYLNCRFGRQLMLRKERGAIQKGLNLDDLRDIPVCIPTSPFQQTIELKFRHALELTSELKRLTLKAGEVLLSALCLADWTPPELLTYSARASDAFAAGRLDAQYFMPAKEQVRQSLAALPGELLSDRANSIREQWLPDRATPEMLVRNYDVTDALVPLLDAEMEPTSAAEIGSMKKVLRDGDVAVSRLRAYLREIAVVRTADDMPSVGSSEFIVLRPKGEAISPETLMVFLRSAPVQTILKWCQDGSQHPRFSEGDLLSIPVPDAVAAVSAEVTSIVQQGFAARRGARQLLDAAKRAVEIAIEDSETSAMAYLAQAEGAA